MTRYRNTSTSSHLEQVLHRLLLEAFRRTASDAEVHSIISCLLLLESGGPFAWFAGGVDGPKENMYVIESY